MVIANVILGSSWIYNLCETLPDMAFVFCILLDVTKVLSELEFTIERVKVMTTPDGRVLDLFFITDGMLVFAVIHRIGYMNEKILRCH